MKNKILSDDRLSSLTDELLFNILSLISPKEAVKTSVLSWKWKVLWTKLPALVLNTKAKSREEIDEFVSKVEKIIDFRTSSEKNLKKLYISFCYSKLHASFINKLVSFVSEKELEEFGLVLDTLINDDSSYYSLPQKMYSMCHLKCLSLRCCSMVPRNTIAWNYLTELKFEMMKLSEGLIGEILSSCPSLTTLFLKDFWGLSSLDITSEHLRSVTVIGDAKHLQLQISALHIHQLRIKVHPEYSSVEIKKISPDAEVDVDFSDGFEISSAVTYMLSTTKLLEGLRLVKNVIVRFEFIKALSMILTNKTKRMEVMYRTFGYNKPLSECNYLTIYALGNADTNIFPAIIWLLKSRNLEVFKLIIDHPPNRNSSNPNSSNPNSSSVERLYKPQSATKRYKQFHKIAEDIQKEQIKKENPSPQVLDDLKDLTWHRLHLIHISITRDPPPELIQEPILELIKLLKDKSRLLKEIKFEFDLSSSRSPQSRRETESQMSKLFEVMFPGSSSRGIQVSVLKPRYSEF